MTVAPEYLVAILGPRAGDHRGDLSNALRESLRALGGTELEASVGLIDGAQTLTRDRKTPIVAVYFGAEHESAGQDGQAITSLLDAAAAILPVVEDLKRYPASVPDALKPINGTAIDAARPDYAPIVNLVLENLGLLRRSRRLFISYRRTQSGTEALQLWSKLEALGYDVFLDTHSVPKTADFQEVLWHRLSDSDVMVLLDTSDFLTSEWTSRELAEAGALTIGLIQVVWPGVAPVSYSDLCERVYLDKDLDFDSKGGLTDGAIARVTSMVEQLRARSLAARHDNLVKEFCDAAATVSVSTAVQPARFISARAGSTDIVAIPAVGVIDAYRFHEASLQFANQLTGSTKVILVYDHRGLRPGWQAFLHWLDNFLPVKAIPITAVAAKLGAP